MNLKKRFWLKKKNLFDKKIASKNNIGEKKVWLEKFLVNEKFR